MKLWAAIKAVSITGTLLAILVWGVSPGNEELKSGILALALILFVLGGLGLGFIAATVSLYQEFVERAKKRKESAQ